MSNRVGIDMGGTFVDVVLAEPDGRMTVRKTPTNYTDPSEGLMKGLGMVLDAREFTTKDLEMVRVGSEFPSKLATDAVAWDEVFSTWTRISLTRAVIAS